MISTQLHTMPVTDATTKNPTFAVQRVSNLRSGARTCAKIAVPQACRTSIWTLARMNVARRPAGSMPSDGRPAATASLWPTYTSTFMATQARRRVTHLFAAATSCCGPPWHAPQHRHTASTLPHSISSISSASCIGDGGASLRRGARRVSSGECSIAMVSLVRLVYLVTLAI